MATPAEISVLYNKYLGRDPLQSGIEAWLATGQSIDQIEQGIANSPEAAIVNAYQDSLGRTPSMDERRFWVNQSGLDTASSVTAIQNSEEAQQFQQQQQAEENKEEEIVDIFDDTTADDTTFDDTTAQDTVTEIQNSQEAQYFAANNDAITQALTELANSPDTMGLGISGALNEDRPDPVIQGADGQYYLTNPELTPNGWIINPDYSTPVYFFHQPIEAGEARGNYAEYSEDYKTATQQGFWRTEEEIKRFWEGEKTEDNPGQLNMNVFREQHPNMDFNQYMSFINENSALYEQGLTPENNPEAFSALTNKYNIKTSFAGETGHIYGWNGSNYTKTFHLDKSFDAGGLIFSLAAAAMTGGLASEGVLGSFLQGLSGFQRTAVLNGVSAAVQSGGDVKAIAGSVVGTLAGGQLGSYVDLGSAAANSALSSSISSAFEQAVVNGEIDFETVLSSGVLGGGMEIGKDLFDAVRTGSEFDFGGLIDQNSDLFAALNGEYDIISREFTGGLIGNVRGAYREFVEQYITGGEWWENATESYDSVKIYTDSKGNATSVDLIGYDGSSEILSWKQFVSKGLDEISGSSAIWDSISGFMDSIPDSWYGTLSDWIKATSKSSGGTYTTEGGSTVTVTTTGTDDSGGGADDDSVDFDCSSVNREQVAGATTGTECGACVDGYEPNEFAECIATIGTTTCPAGQYFNETTLNCEDEVFFTPGQPCNKEDGTQGVFDADGNCVDAAVTGTGDGTGTGGKAGEACPVEETGEDGTLQDDGEGNLTCVATGTGTGDTGGTGDTRKAGDACTDEATNQQGTLQEDAQGNLICVVSGDTPTVDTGTTATQTCSDPNRATKEDGSCAELCKDGTIPDQHEEGLCGNPLITTTGPGGGDGTEECENNATIESNCNECADGSLPSEHENNDCNQRLITTGGGSTNVTEVDCTLVECQSPRPDGEAGVAWDTCCTGDSTVITTGGGGSEEDKCKLAECQSPRPEGDAGALWDQCCKETPVTTTTGGGGGGDGGGMFGGSGLGSFSPAGQPGMFDPTITAGVTLEQARKFPIENFLQQYVAGMNNQNASITSLFEDLV
jgi:hypothetical protein